MPRQTNVSIENNFTKGLLTEHTGLNFPENACTETFNCIFDRSGKVSRRKGFDYEAFSTSEQINRPGNAITYYKWNNAGGNGNVRILVLQVGNLLHFYRPSSATSTVPLSLNKLSSTVTLSSLALSASSGGGTEAQIGNALGVECQFSEGNGYLFVFHPFLEPFYCTYTDGVIIATRITIKIRDFEGITETDPNQSDTLRPGTTDNRHFYNLTNQGWGKFYTDAATTIGGPYVVPVGVGSTTWTVTKADLPIQLGDRLQFFSSNTTVPSTGVSQPPPNTSGLYIYGIAEVYNTSLLQIQVKLTHSQGTGSSGNWTVVPEPPRISIWNATMGNYPSNSDVWWSFKNTSNVFDPVGVSNFVSLSGAPAPKGFYILDAFRQRRTTLSGLPGIPDVVSTVLPRTGTWFQGRVWYAGVDDPKFTENIYFSQTVENVKQFGLCYQTNDPTSEERFDLLPTDGGIIRIQGAGTIHKLIPVQNGVLVFTANGIWFISGSQGVGFAATDYTVIKISDIKTISHTSFVMVEGYPMWWNEDGIWAITPGQGGGYSVSSLTNDTIASLFSEIPLHSKRIARGDYNPLTTTIQWCYRNTGETEIELQYNFDRILNFNLSTKAFYPWSFPNTNPNIHGVVYVEGSVGINNPSVSKFKYITSVGVPTFFTFSEERNETYTDWVLASLPNVYISYFVTGYKLHGNTQRKFQSNYLYLYVDNEDPGEFYVKGLWDYSSSPSSGRWSVPEKFTYLSSNFSHRIKRVKIRGHGLSLQFKIESSATKPFDLIGWSAYETSSAGI